MILAKRAIVKPNASRPNAANPLESDGRMSGIGLEKLEVLIGEFTDWLWQAPVVRPELGRSIMLQSGVQRPAS